MVLHCRLSSLQTVTNDNFGPLIAYLLPGATALAGLSTFSATLQTWLASAPDSPPTIGGFLYLTLAALAVGMTVSAVRWAVVDTIHRWTGVRSPQLDFSKLGDNVEAFRLLIESHYRYYQFHANMFVALAFCFGCLWIDGRTLHPWMVVALGFLEVIFFATSRDNLRKYYLRSSQLLAASRKGKAKNC